MGKVTAAVEGSLSNRTHIGCDENYGWDIDDHDMYQHKNFEVKTIVGKRDPAIQCDNARATKSEDVSTPEAGVVSEVGMADSMCQSLKKAISLRKIALEQNTEADLANNDSYGQLLASTVTKVEVPSKGAAILDQTNTNQLLSNEEQIKLDEVVLHVVDGEESNNIVWRDTMPIAHDNQGPKLDSDCTLCSSHEDIVIETGKCSTAIRTSRTRRQHRCISATIELKLAASAIHISRRAQPRRQSSEALSSFSSAVQLRQPQSHHCFTIAVVMLLSPCSSPAATAYSRDRYSLLRSTRAEPIIFSRRYRCHNPRP
ncbi:hypothetical protein M0R45_030692 [Rubus argutus]|uniref:Uncharacterized protein n=1 Tax=Rubus argutus TaxID=59490 RepID=A0AAW1WFV3_RUBAR